jgi:two-component system cell cycle sensor histidine kinase/response regulator CckA
MGELDPVTGARRSPLRILIIEDNPPDAELMVAAVRRGGYEVQFDVADTPELFRERLARAEYDVILADYNLSSWTALDALGILRQSGKDIPVIVTTGSLGDEAAVECIKQGAEDFVLKDRPARLPLAIERALEERSLRAEGRRAAEALRASETRYRRLFEAGKDGVLILDAATGDITDVNPFMVELLGYAHGEFIGKKLWEIGVFKNIVASKTAFRELQNKEYIRYEDLPLARSDGRPVDVEFVSNAYWVDGKKVIQCNVRDITAHKRIEEALVRLRKAVDASGEVIFMTNREGIVTFINPEFTRLYGYTEDEVVGKVTPRILKSGTMQPESYLSFWTEILEKRIAKGEMVNKTKAGKLVTVESSANPILDEQGNITGFLAIQRDATARKQLEDQLRQAQKMEAIGRLAGGVAHDFNNLLTIISGYGQLILGALPEKDPLRTQLTEVLKASERATSLTRQLLAFGRRQVLAPRVLDLNEVIVDTEKMLRRLIGEDIELVTVPGRELSHVKADPGQIEQVILNLALNARDAMPKGGRLTIEASSVTLDEVYADQHISVQPGPYVMLAVSDTGCGMDRETQAHLFEPFFTTKEKGKGTGLGLATVYGIVKQSGGYIWVYSEPGQGTTFKVYLPKIQEPVEATQAPPAERVSAGGSETILLVEDDSSVRSLVHAVLEPRGYKLLVARNGDDALFLCEQHKGPIHLLLTDVVMPGMSGRELAERLSPLHREMKILYMSGYTDNAIVHHGVLEANVRFLQKPFSPPALASKVRTVLNEQR